MPRITSSHSQRVAPYRSAAPAKYKTKEPSFEVEKLRSTALTVASAPASLDACKPSSTSSAADNTCTLSAETVKPVKSGENQASYTVHWNTPQSLRYGKEHNLIRFGVNCLYIKADPYDSPSESAPDEWCVQNYQAVRKRLNQKQVERGFEVLICGHKLHCQIQLNEQQEIKSFITLPALRYFLSCFGIRDTQHLEWFFIKETEQKLKYPSGLIRSYLPYSIYNVEDMQTLFPKFLAAFESEQSWFNYTHSIL